MSIANYLVNLTDGLTSQGVLGSLKGGTGLTTVGSSGQAIVSDGTNWVSQTVASGAPKVSQISYTGDNTAANPTGGETVTLTGTGFAAGARVLINQTQVSVVTIVSATVITFTAPALATGSYVLYVVNTDGGTAVLVPGIQYSGVPAWTTAAGTLATVYETAAISSTVAATSDSAVTYSVTSGALPAGATLAANGTISGTSPVTASSTTYTFVIRATDAENQETDRTFNLTINPDVVTWSSPANAAALVGAPGVVYSSALSAASAAGQTVSYSADALPTGLAISGATITGTPTTAGTSSTTLTATAANTNRSAQVTISWTITVAADAYFPVTTLLLNSETAALPFTADASTNNFAVTAFGDAKPNNFNPYTPGYYSNYFDGTGDYLQCAYNSAFDLSSSDFTIESWVRTTDSSSNYPSIIGRWQSAGNACWDFRPRSTDIGNYFVFVYSTNGTTSVSVNSNTIITDGAWHHLVAVRSGNNFALFVDGIRKQTASFTGVTIFNSVSSPLYVGYDPYGATYYTGYQSNTRLVKGTAVYDPTLTTLTVPTTPLTAIANTSLLTCQSNRFIDTSTNNFTLTVNGNTSISSFDPFVPNTSYATYGSTYFDGTGDYLQTPASVSSSLGTSNFTWECWIYRNAVTDATYADAICCVSTGTNGFAVAVNADGKVGYAISSAGTWDVRRGVDPGDPRGSIVISLNTWVHIALVRNGSTFTGYVNGVQDQTFTSSASISSISSNYNIGKWHDGYNRYWNGYISNFRFVIGTAVYTSAFTPPTSPLTAVTNTALLTCQTNQPINNQTFLDNSTNAFPITRSGNATQGSFSPYGANWSNYFDGSGDYLSTTDPATTSGALTIECWVYPVTQVYTGDAFIAGDSGNAAGAWALSFNSTTRTIGVWLDSYSGIAINSNNTISYNAWSHIALVKTGGIIYLYINGTRQTATYSQAGSFGRGSSINIGRYTGGGQEFTGYISNLRMVYGTAIYTGTTYTVPTAPLTAVPGTQLLTCQSPNLVDNSLNAFTITKAGDVSTQKFNPFAVVTQTPLTHSVYFDGTGDWLNTATNAALALGAADFTTECWIYPTTTASNQVVFDCRPDGSHGAYAAMLFESGYIRWYVSSATQIQSTSTLTLNTWTHVAVTRSSGTTKMYINGVVSGSAWTDSTTYLIGAAGLNIGASTWSAGRGAFTGYVSNVRVVKGTALYTTTFTPATTALTAVANTSLLACQDATIKDNSINNFAITATGNTTPRQQNPFGFTTSSTQEYSTTTFGGSVYLDGTGDCLSIPRNAALVPLASQNFTFEAWVYLTAAPSGTGVQIMGLQEYGSASDWVLQVASDLTPSLWISPTVTTYGSGIAIRTNTWNHIAVVRKNTNTINVYVNGQAGTTHTTTTTLVGGGSYPFTIGADQNGDEVNVTGYIADVRITGEAVYTSNFVPPTAPLTAITNTTFLLNADKAAIADKSGKVVLESVGDAKISTAVKKYGSSSMSFDGTGDYLTVPFNQGFNFGASNFTIEFWVNTTSAAAYATALRLGDTWTTGSWSLYLNDANGTGYPSWWSQTLANSVLTSGVAINDGAWHHIAVVRNGTTITMYINGTSRGTLAVSTNSVGDSTTKLWIARDASNVRELAGYIDDLRITRGYARYTANFTPPTTLLTK